MSYSSLSVINNNQISLPHPSTWPSFPNFNIYKKLFIKSIKEEILQIILVKIKKNNENQNQLINNNNNNNNNFIEEDDIYYYHINDINNIKNYSSNSFFCFFYNNFPIQKVEIFGIVTKIGRSNNTIKDIFVVDDGTDNITCYVYYNLKQIYLENNQLNETIKPKIDEYDLINLDNLSRGNLVIVSGILFIINDSLDRHIAIKVSNYNIIDDPNIETYEMLTRLRQNKLKN